MFLNQPPSLYTVDNPLFWDSSFFFPQTLSYRILLLCFPCPHHASFFFFVFSMFTMFNVLSTIVSVSIVSLGKHINYQPKQIFQVIPAPVFLLKSNASLVICLILNCKITFQKNNYFRSQAFYSSSSFLIQGSTLKYLAIYVILCHPKHPLFSFLRSRLPWVITTVIDCYP